MSVTRFRTNTMANFTERMVKKSTKKSEEATERLASGKRINSASDDAAGLAISQKLTTQTRGFKQANKNIADARSLVQTAEGGLSEIQQNLQRMRELSIQAANGTLTKKDRQSLNEEFQQLKKEIDRTATQTRFNKINLLGPSSTKKSQSDIVFVIDDTTSMGPLQEELKNNIDQFTNQITESGVNDIRFGLTEFNDDPTQINFSSGKWTTDKNELAKEIDNLSQSGGQEDSMEAIQSVINNYDFRSNDKGQVKHAIFVTDEDSDDGSAASTPNLLPSTITEAKSEGLRIHGVYPSGTNEYDELTSKTDGKNVDIGQPDWGEKLTSEIGGNIGGPTLKFDENLNIHVGPNKGQNIDLKLFDSRTIKLGIKSLDLKNPKNAQKALNKLDEALEKTSSARAEFGSFLNRFKLMTDYNSIANTNLESSKSLIQDANYAREVQKRTSNDILRQAGTSLLSQAVNISEVTLQLI